MTCASGKAKLNLLLRRCPYVLVLSGNVKNQIVDSTRFVNNASMRNKQLARIENRLWEYLFIWNVDL